MLPVVAGAAVTRRQILAYAVLTAASTALPVIMGFAGMIYAWVAAITGALFILSAGDVMMHGDGGAARTKSMRLFAYSIFYLFVLFACLPAERLAGFMPNPGF